MKSGFKRAIHWNKYHPKVTVEQRNRYVDFLINSSFQGENRLFVLSFENNGGRTSYVRYYFPLVEIKDCNVMIDGQNVFYQPVKDNLITYDNMQKIAAVQGNDYTTGRLLDYNYFKRYCQMIAIDLSKQKAHKADSKAILKINFTANLDRDRNTTMFFVMEEMKETISIFFFTLI